VVFSHIARGGETQGGLPAPAECKMNPPTKSPDSPLIPLYPICGKPCSPEDVVTDAKGRAVHKECYRTGLIEGKEHL